MPSWNIFINFRIWCKGLASLCTLLGVTWLVALIFIEEDLPVVFEFLFVLLNGLQGVYIFIFQCVLNNQVRPVLFQFFCRKFSRTGSSFSVCKKIISQYLFNFIQEKIKTVFFPFFPCNNKSEEFKKGQTWLRDIVWKGRRMISLIE